MGGWGAGRLQIKPGNKLFAKPLLELKQRKKNCSKVDGGNIELKLENLANAKQFHRNKLHY